MNKIRNSIIAGLIFGVLMHAFSLLFFHKHLSWMQGFTSGICFGMIVYFMGKYKSVRK